ncbi:MAG: hypothetical protein ACI9F9_001570 [Candidatus Paceibacteria bacterium]
MEFPELQSLWSEVHKKLGDDVVFLCINRGDSKEVISRYWDKHGFTMKPVRQEGNTAAETLGVLGYPTIYVIGPDGTIRYGSAKWDASAVRNALLN